MDASKLPTAIINGVRLYRQGTQGKVRGVLIEGRIIFTGGRHGEHSVGSEDSARVLTHWEGYCTNNGLGMSAGAWVEFHTGNAWRQVQVQGASGIASKTVLVGSFRYIKSGKPSAPRRLPKDQLYVLRSSH